MKALRLVYKLNNFHRFDDKQDYPVRISNTLCDNLLAPHELIFR